MFRQKLGPLVIKSPDLIQDFKAFLQSKRAVTSLIWREKYAKSGPLMHWAATLWSRQHTLLLACTLFEFGLMPACV